MLCGTGNAIYASLFTKDAPTLKNANSPRDPYVNMFRVVNEDDIVPKVMKGFNARWHAME